MKNLKLMAVLATMLLLSACASAPKPLDLEKMKASKISQIYLGAENEIQVNFLASSAGSSSGAIAGGLLGGLIGGAIDAGINSKRKKQANQDITAVRSQMASFDFANEFNQRLVDSLEAEVFAEDLQVTLMDADQKPEDGMVLHSQYHLSHHFTHVNLQVIAVMNDVQDKPITRSYMVISKIEGTESDREQNMALIEQSNAEQLKASIDVAMSEVLSLINNDFSGQYIYNKESPKVTFSDGTYPISANVMQDKDNKIVAGTQFGMTSIYSIDKEVVEFN